MRLYRQQDVPEDERALLCRQSQFAGIVRLIVWCGLMAVFPISGWRAGSPLAFWGGIAVAAIVIPIALLDLGKLFRSTNWLMRITSDGLWINLRSYRVRNNRTDIQSVLYLDYAEIASVGRHTEAYTTPSELVSGPGSYGEVGGSTIWRDDFLEIQLNHDQTDELMAALNNLRNSASSGQRQIRIPHNSVWLASPSVIRIAWVSDHGHAVLPRLSKALERIDGNVRVVDPSRRERPDWRKLTAEEVVELARELVKVQGACVEATTLLVRAGGIPYLEANAQVQQFEDEEIVPGPAPPG